MPSTTLTRPSTRSLADYSELKRRVQETLLLGQQRIEYEKVRTYWTTGSYIHQHLFFHNDRAVYRKNVVGRLAEDLDVSDTLLYQCLYFYCAFQNLYARTNSALQALFWSVFRALMRIADEKKRLALAYQAAKEEWTSREVEIEVRNLNYAKRISESSNQKPAPLPLVCLGPFCTYKIIRPETLHSRSKELLLDFGFGFRVEMSRFKKGGKHSADAIVTLDQEDAPLKTEAANDDVLYTYQAYVEKVLDGDTLKLEFQLGGGRRKQETIRLNHIDCPELDTPEGKAAKRFVENELAACDFITVKSIRTRKEKWGRYLGDVFYMKKGKLIYLNQLLLDKGYAVRVRH